VTGTNSPPAIAEQTQLLEDAVNVVLDCRELYRETLSDLLVRKSAIYELEDLEFPPRQVTLGFNATIPVLTIAWPFAKLSQDGFEGSR
jgi:hypothetical protein